MLVSKLALKVSGARSVDLNFESDLGGGRLSVVGAAEGIVAGVDALDPAALPPHERAGTATAGDQPAHHGLPLGD